MPETHLVYKLEGDVREIDVFKLAPTLLALGELIEDANRQLFPNGRDIAVNVKPFREGSFIVDLTLFPATNLQHLIDFFTPHSLEQLKTLLEVIGLIGGGTFGAVKAIKALKGKPKTIEEIKPGEFRYTSADDNSVTVDKSVHNLLSNSQITQNIFNIYDRPMKDQPSIEDIKTYLEGDEDDAVVVKRDDVVVIREFVSPDRATTTAQVMSKETMTHNVFLNPKRGAFGDDPKDWSFWRGDAIITATIRDKEFLANVRTGDVRLNQNDLLEVDLLERQKIIGTRVQKPTYEIIKVTDYRKGQESTQTELPERAITFDE